FGSSVFARPDPVEGNFEKDFLPMSILPMPVRCVSVSGRQTGPAGSPNGPRNARGAHAMRYMMMIKGDADYEAGKPASEKLQGLMGEFIGKCAADGTFVDGAGLLPSSRGFKARARNGEISFTDGPFAEARE